MVILNNTKILWIMQIIIKYTWSIFMSSNNFFKQRFFEYIKMPKDSSAKYYQNKKERFQKTAPEKEEIEKKQEHSYEQYKNLPEDEK